MRKFKVVRKWPGGPGVGAIGEMGIENVAFEKSSNYGRWHALSELEGFVEEIKDPERFWIVSIAGEVSETGWSGVPSYLRFRTKESAEKFRDALKDTHGAEPKFVKVVAMCDALNNRVTN
jgi:hypothetical protein